MVEDAAHEGWLAIFPAGKGGRVAFGGLAAQGFESLCGDGRSIESVAEWAVAAVPFLEDEKFPSGGHGRLAPSEIVEGVARLCAWREEADMAAGDEEAAHGFGGCAFGQWRGPEDGGELG